MIKVGYYRHFKGKEYRVIGFAKHSETLEEFVVYKDSEGVLWVRPYKMFIETVDFNGQKMPRFTFLHP